MRIIPRSPHTGTYGARFSYRRRYPSRARGSDRQDSRRAARPLDQHLQTSFAQPSSSGELVRAQQCCALEDRTRRPLTGIGDHPSRAHHRRRLHRAPARARFGNPRRTDARRVRGAEEWRSSSLFGERDRAALAYADAMTREIHVPDSVYAPLKGIFSQRGIVELTVLIGTYNMHARVLQALEIDPQPPAQPPAYPCGAA